ncbi:MAG: hypothetical protein IJC71_03870, partial [Clostridia bacterium]|nr:hypothetical protein [Clostridia bacterium]
QTLEEQLEPMRVKAEKEKKYNTLYGELKGLEISLWMLRLDALKSELDRLSGDRNIAAYAAQECKQQIDSTYETNERLTEEIISIDRKQDELRAEIREKEAEKASVTSLISLKKAEIDRNVREMDRLREEAADYEQRKNVILQTIEEKERAVKILEEEAASLRQEIAETERQSTDLSVVLSEKNGRLYALRDNATALQLKLGECRIGLSSVTASRAALAQQLADVGRKDAADRKNLDEAKEKLDAMEVFLEEKQQAKNSLLNIANGYRLKIESRQKKYDTARARYDELAQKLREDTSRLKILMDLERDYEGFNRSVKLVMRDAENHALRGIHGPVSKLLQVDDRYVVAAETALGAGMQNIICDREEDAKAAIEMLKRRDAGRATFLPISAVKGTELDDRALRGERGFVGILSQLVRHDAIYDGVFRSLLGRTAVCESLDAAIALARKNSYKFRIVTLDGQVINAGGAMTGGSQNKSYGILSRANEISRLTAEIENMKSRISADESLLRALEQELNAAKYSLESSENERQMLETELAALEAQLAERRETYRLMETGLRDADAVRTELSARIHSLDAELAVGQKNEASLEAEEKKILASVEDVQQEINAVAAQLNGLNLRLNEYRAKLQEHDLSAGAAGSASYGWYS